MQESQFLSAMWGYSRKYPSANQEESSHQEFQGGTLILDFSAFTTVRKEFLLLGHPIYGIFVTAAWPD